MKFYSIHKQSPPVSFKEAVILGQAPDKGLYMPETIPQVEKNLIEHAGQYSNQEIAFRVMLPYAGHDIPEENLYSIISESINFPVPLVKIADDIFSLELFHGPTLAFKDVGARFMSRCLGYFLQGHEKKVTVLVATSGDTGGAVAHGFYQTKGVEVVILYPSGMVSPVQEKQLTTLGGNIHCLEIEGTFDDCQQMVKQAFADGQVTQKIFLTSANSINVARWLPQQVYYFFAWQQWPDANHPPVMTVPSGNFGNICAGILAQQSGLPVKHFIAACNANDVVPRFLQTKEYRPAKAIATLSNAMDVGDPGNFIRILEIFRHDFARLQQHLSAFSIGDAETLSGIRELYNHFGYLADPHGAVGYLSLKKYLKNHPQAKGIFLETAHPVKFPAAVEKAIGQKPEIPSALAAWMQAEKKSIRMKADYNLLKNFLLD